jgi:serine/threonine-protein kinase
MTDRKSGVLGELDPLIGLTISGRYRVHALIGQGGMGKVFRAQQIPLGRAVALKVLEAGRVDQEFQRRFFQEAAILARLQSPHTVTIYDYGREGDLFFIAMELVSGGSLDKVLLQQGALPVQRALSIAQQICRSLREAHGQGVIHRDLKPANVVITQDEDGNELVKVLDFGLAKRLNASIPEDTQNDTVPGSPKYMAPEVIRQQPIDGRTDIYSLGVMLYQMLVGKVPFDREAAMDILLAHLHEQPPPMRQMNPNLQISPKLEQVVMRCLTKTPDQRFANVRELLEVLHGLSLELGMRPSQSLRPPSDRPPSDRPPSERPPGGGVRPSGAQTKLRLSGTDLQPGAHSLRPKAVRPWPLIAAASVIGAGTVLFLVLRSVAHDSSAAPPSAPPAAPPAAPAQPAAPAPSAAAAPGAADPSGEADMVFTAKDIEDPAAPAVTLIVNSTPPGAKVFVVGKLLGTTPGRFQLHHSSAKPGGMLPVALRLEGYEPKIMRRVVDAKELTIDATLDPLPAAVPPPRARALQLPGDDVADPAEPAEEGAEGEVLDIKPSAPEPEEGAPEPEAPEEEPPAPPAE